MYNHYPFATTPTSALPFPFSVEDCATPKSLLSPSSNFKCTIFPPAQPQPQQLFNTELMFPSASVSGVFGHPSNIGSTEMYANSNNSNPNSNDQEAYGQWFLEEEESNQFQQQQQLFKFAEQGQNSREEQRSSNASPMEDLSPSSATSNGDKIKTDRICYNCLTRDTPLWRRGRDNKLLCNRCGLYYKRCNRDRPVSLNISANNRKRPCKSVDHMEGTAAMDYEQPRKKINTNSFTSPSSTASTCSSSSTPSLLIPNSYSNSPSYYNNNNIYATVPQPSISIPYPQQAQPQPQQQLQVPSSKAPIKISFSENKIEIGNKQTSFQDSSLMESILNCLKFKQPSL